MTDKFGFGWGFENCIVAFDYINHALLCFRLCQKYSILNFSALHGYLEQYVLNHGPCYNNGYYQSWRICSEHWVWKISFVHHSPFQALKIYSYNFDIFINK